MTDLTDRMRTCAAHILAEMGRTQHDEVPQVYTDAAKLLLEASNALDAVPAPLGELMEIIAPVSAPDNSMSRAGTVPKAVWTAGDLPAVPDGAPPRPRNKHICPNCDSRATKRVHRYRHKVALSCPVCQHEWESQP